MSDEGYIKFDCAWTMGAAIPNGQIADLIEWRNRLFDAGLIGYDDERDVGFGNISRRRPGALEFVISATQTGHIPVATGREFSRVVGYDMEANRIVCRGPRRASSESLTHAAIYELSPDWGAVVHAHHRALWDALAASVPATAATIRYGTPDMARDLCRLYRDTDLPDVRMAVMAGHEAGLISFGVSLEEAASRLLEMLAH